MQATLIGSQHTAVELQWAIVDDLCPHIRSLLPAALVETLPIGESSNPLEQISAALAGQTLDTLHLVAHGRSGAIRLGGRWLDAAALLANAALLARWNVRRLALWSCDVGHDRGFVALLSELTGAEVWSSDQPLGGGEAWSLQVQTNSASAQAEAPSAPFADAAIAAWPHQLNPKDCPKPFITELAGVLISTPLEVKGTRVQQNEVTLASSQPSVEAGSIFFRQTNSDSNGNNLLGNLSYREEGGKEVIIKGELSRQAKGIDGKPQDVEAYYFVADDLSFAYVLVLYTKDGSTENLRYFEPGGTYKTSSDFKCQAYLSPEVIAEITDPGEPEKKTFTLPPDDENGGGDNNSGGDNGGDNKPPIESQIIVVKDPEGDPLPEESFTTDIDPEDNRVTVTLVDADPDKPGDQPFDDGTYEVFFGDKELGGIVVNDKQLTELFGGPCAEAIFTTKNKNLFSSSRSSKRSSKKSDKLTGSRSNRLEATAHGDSFDVLIGGAGSDTYQLGNQAGAFYAKHGVNDYARISRFQANDALVLHGQSSDYSLGGVTSVNGQLGHALSYNGDMIALIQGDEGVISGLRGNLNAPQITYV
jgi:hypothetical protein